MKIRVLSFILFLSFMGCGPMNHRPQMSATNTPSSLGNTGGTYPSQNNQFYGYISSDHTPEWGENTYHFRFVYSKNLESLSDQATVKVQYQMPEMPSMGESEEIAVREPDGSFTATVFYSMSGRWQVTLKITDGTTQDEYTFEATL